MRQSPLAHVALITSVLALIVMMLGAYTRLTNAGLSCPDWPHCYGYLTAPHTSEQKQIAAERYPSTPVDVKKAWTEMTHRYLAGAEGILILVLATLLLIQRHQGDKTPVIVACTLVLLLGSQIMLGMLTVTEQLKPVIVLGHLLNGLALASLSWFAFLHANNRNRFNMPLTHPTMHCFAWLGLAIVFLQITLGGWVSTHEAGLACIDFPYCQGRLWPTMQWAHLESDLITIHMLHRIGALVTGTYLFTLALFILINNAKTTFIAHVMLGLITLQITLGILTIFWLRPVWLALLHHAVAIGILLTMITFVFQTSQRFRATPS